MKKLIIMLVCLSGLSSVKAQTEKEAVIATIKNFFTGMKSADTVLLKMALSTTAILQTISSDGGDVHVKNEPISDFITFVGTLVKGDADEQIEIGNVNIDADLAAVWIPYKFFYKGKFSHCGVNSFQLVKIANAWQIQYIIDTRRKEGCN